MLIPDIGRDRDKIVQPFRTHGIQFGLAAAGDDDTPPGAGECQGDGAANPAPAARHDRYTHETCCLY
jgi:hypothetical protein